MSRRIQIVLTDDQYAFLLEESYLQSLSISELIRRAIETTYGVMGDRKVHLIRHTPGRRAGHRLDPEPPRFDPPF